VSLERSVVLACSPERAFELFTRRVSDWWPPERRHTRDPAGRMVLDPERFVEMGDGREVPLGRVLAWEPGARLELTWFPGTDADHPTHVEVRFLADGAGTRVVVVHRPLPSSEALWAARAPRYAASWDLVLAALGAAPVDGW
jgi:uncharacterized protein YndB with AHSA1/START domain